MTDDPRVIIADDNPVVRSGLVALLEADGIEVIAQASDGRQAVELTHELRPDVVLLDVQMPLLDGLGAADQLAGVTRILMLTYTDTPEVIKKALSIGAAGYLVHGSFTSEELLAAVRQTARGANPLSPVAVSALVGALQQGQTPPPPAEHKTGFGLSQREAEIMDLIAQGFSNTEIAERLFLAEKTVKNHVNRIYAKLAVPSRAAAVSLWLGASGGVRW